MRLFLAAAVFLLLALAAHAEAQDPTLEDRVTNIRDRVTSLGTAVAEKTTDWVEQIRNSEFVESSKQWLTNAFQDIKKTVTGQ